MRITPTLYIFETLKLHIPTALRRGSAFYLEQDFCYFNILVFAKVLVSLDHWTA